MSGKDSASPKEYPLVKAELWRSWLESNHGKQSGVWVVFPKKTVNEPTMSYEEALDIALAYGWIDISIRKIDEKTFGRKFTPRRPESVWSAGNVERARRLIKEGRMAKWGMEAYEKRLTKPRAVKKSSEIQLGQLPDFRPVVFFIARPESSLQATIHGKVRVTLDDIAMSVLRVVRLVVHRVVNSKA